MAPTEPRSGPVATGPVATGRAHAGAARPRRALPVRDARTAALPVPARRAAARCAPAGVGTAVGGIDPTYLAPPGFVPTSVAQPTTSEVHSVPPEQASSPLYGGAAYGLAPGQQLTRSILPGNNGYAIASLILGIFGFLIVTGFFSIVFGWVSFGQINKSDGLQRGRPLAIVGILLSLAWWVIGLLWIVHKIKHA